VYSLSKIFISGIWVSLLFGVYCNTFGSWSSFRSLGCGFKVISYFEVNDFFSLATFGIIVCDHLDIIFII
jgi:hypothetical protein